MSNIEWFKNEMELVNEFLQETKGLILEVESLEKQLAILTEEEARSKTVEGIKEKLQTLTRIKEAYIAEEILGTLDILSSVDEGEALSEAACDVMKKINIWTRKYFMVL